MKKRDLTKLVMIGIGAGLIVGGCDNSRGPDNGAPGGPPPGNGGPGLEQMGPDMQAFFTSLSSDSQNKFMQLDAQHKMMAIEMAMQTCSGQNKCSGMGGCNTSQHECAGKNSCKGQGGNPVKDPNKAIEAQYKNQMNQRQKTNGGMGGSTNYNNNGSSRPYSGPNNH